MAKDKSYCLNFDDASYLILFLSEACSNKELEHMQVLPIFDEDGNPESWDLCYRYY